MEESESDSIRYQRLKQISTRSLEESVKHLTTDRLESCYPTIAASAKGHEALRQARSQIANYWLTTAEKEFEAVFEERDIHQKMIELDELLYAAKARMEKGEEDERNKGNENEPVFMDKLAPSQVVDAHLSKYQQQEVESLEGELEKVKNENKELLEKLKQDDEKIKQTVSDIDTTLGEVNSAVESANGLPSRVEIGQFVDTAVS